MRIVCETCQAKYSISDDKVAGKVFKIRCKKCSAVIVVRGGASVSEPPAPMPAEDAIWHLVIAQDQLGPFTAAEVERKLAGGEATGDTFGWHEGQDDWLPLAQIDAFAASLAPPAPATARADPSDVFAARRGDDSGELFASPAPQAAAQRLRGERNESSVLFSLGNLQQLAHQPARTTAAASPGNEGSGLIDIRSMASAYLGGATAGAKPTSAGIGSIDDLPVFGGGGFSEPAVIVPTAAPRANHKLLYAMIAAMAALAIAATIMLVMLMKGDPKPQQIATAAPAPPPPAAPMPEPVEPPPPVAAPAQAAEPPPVAPAPAAAPHPQPPHRDPAAKVAAPKRAVEPVASPPPPKEAPAGDCSDVSCMVNDYAGACCAKYKPHAAGEPPPRIASDLPDGLDKPMIGAGIDKIRARVSQCGDKSTARGKVKVHVKVGPDGHVATISTEESPDPKLADCVVAAMRGATFAKTQKGGSFGYPFVF